MGIGKMVLKLKSADSAHYIEKHTTGGPLLYQHQLVGWLESYGLQYVEKYDDRFNTTHHLINHE